MWPEQPKPLLEEDADAELFISRAMPKSDTFTCPRWLINKLAGLMSLRLLRKGHAGCARRPEERKGGVYVHHMPTPLPTP
jgi:hypothetical protein